MGAERIVDAQVFVLHNALLIQVELRVLSGDGEMKLFPGVIIAIHAEDGTIDVQYDMGVLRNVPAYLEETKKVRITWQWPGAVLEETK